MNNITNPRWIFLFGTLPLLVLAGLMYSTYQVVHTQITADQLASWNSMAVFLAVIMGVGVLFASYCIFHKARFSPVYASLLFALHLGYLYAFVNEIGNMVPWSIPRWMLPENLDYLTFAMMMPMLVYTLLLVVVWFTKTFHGRGHYQSLLLVVVIPIGLYLFIQVAVPFLGDFSHAFQGHIIVIFFIVGTVLFFFFLFHWIYQYASSKTISKGGSLVIRYLIGLVFPILGLLLNMTMGVDSSEGIFGDFVSPWYFVLATANGLLLVAPESESPPLRLLRFGGRAFTFPFILYFMIVFLPYLPFSIIAIIIVGLGFLMLTPIMLCVLQSIDLVRDWKSLMAHYNPIILGAVLCAGLCALPTVITTSYFSDRANLQSALKYVFDDHDEKEDINIAALESTLNTISSHKRGSRGNNIMGSKLPYLTSYYNWIVMDNMTLSFTKLTRLREVFLGANPAVPSIRRRWSSSAGKVSISSSEVRSTYDHDQQSYTTWVDLELTNRSKRRFQEYVTTLQLPVGAWVSDYYLYVGDRKEMGILTDKKSANWVYDQIRNTNRDPGLLSYRNDGSISFKVFPFEGEQVRKTGFEIKHKHPFILELDSLSLTMGHASKVSSVAVEKGNAVYIPWEVKAKLDRVARQPYFHFIVDKSINATLTDKQVSQHIDELIATYPDYAYGAKVSLTNYKSATTDLDENWPVLSSQIKNEGGFGVGMEIRKILINSFERVGSDYPVIVVIGPTAHAVIDKGFSNLEFTYPDHRYFHAYGGGFDFESYHLSKPKEIVEGVTTLTPRKVVAWPDHESPRVFLSDDASASIGLISIDRLSIEFDDSWMSGLALAGEIMAQEVRPNGTSSDWVDIVKGSFDSRIMTPLTAYIVVETEAQKTVLLRKQKQVLAGNQHLDLGDDVSSMSEPSFWAMMLFLIIFFWYQLRQKSIKRAS